jgi:ABC-type antimicrobial peptide transport system permease subunit
VRTGGPAGPLGAQVVRLVRALEPNLPVHRVRTLDQVRDDALAEQRSGSAVIGIMGLLALGLATVGLYAVIVFAVRQRTREIGIRMALGARQDDVVRMFVGRGLQLTLIGLLIGLAISVAATQAVRSMLFGVTPTDPVAFVGVTAVFVGVAILACWLPARRAALVDPVTTMRTE